MGLCAAESVDRVLRPMTALLMEITLKNNKVLTFPW